MNEWFSAYSMAGVAYSRVSTFSGDYLRVTDNKGKTHTEDKPDEGTKKEETVYAFLDWQGQLKSATVSEWLHNEQGFRQTADQSILENIKNIKGDDLPEQNGTSLMWNSDEHDLYYQGTTTANFAGEISNDEVYHYYQMADVFVSASVGLATSL